MLTMPDQARSWAFPSRVLSLHWARRVREELPGCNAAHNYAVIRIKPNVTVSPEGDAPLPSAELQGRRLDLTRDLHPQHLCSHLRQFLTLSIQDLQVQTSALPHKDLSVTGQQWHMMCMLSIASMQQSSHALVRSICLHHHHCVASLTMLDLQAVSHRRKLSCLCMMISGRHDMSRSSAQG